MDMKKKIEATEHVKSLVAVAENFIGDRVLIFGASNTTLVEELVRKNREVALLDIRQSAFSKFKEFKVDMLLVQEGKEFDGVGKYNTIIFYDTMHHLQDKNKIIKECLKILKGKASILLYEPNIYTKLIREYDQFGELKNSMYKWSLIRLLKKNAFKVKLLSSEELISRKRKFKRFIISLQKMQIDPIFRILLIAIKR